MKIVRSVRECKDVLGIHKMVGFVPTMGALHEGHLRLVQHSVAENEFSVCSVFVNPTQFGPREDFNKYPRDLDRDSRLLEKVGCDLVFAPQVSDIYESSSTTVKVSGVTEGFEGALRPGHFEGVATVVAKLMGIVKPRAAYFGTKDLQQCAVVNRLVRDLFLPVELRFIETVRDESGLALSSRNAYLSDEELALAKTLNHTLRRAALALQESQGAEATGSILELGRREIESRGFVLDYLDLVEPTTFRTVSVPSPQSRLVVAARVGPVRLLDNWSVWNSPLSFES